MKRMVAAGRWPDDWDQDDVQYDPLPERMEGPYEEPEPEHCGWCGRPIQTCIDDPCDHFARDPNEG